jgi:hypothetical protein
MVIMTGGRKSEKISEILKITSNKKIWDENVFMDSGEATFGE